MGRLHFTAGALARAIPSGTSPASAGTASPDDASHAVAHEDRGGNKTNTKQHNTATINKRRERVGKRGKGWEEEEEERNTPTQTNTNTNTQTQTNTTRTNEQNKQEEKRGKKRKKRRRKKRRKRRWKRRRKKRRKKRRKSVLTQWGATLVN